CNPEIVVGGGGRSHESADALAIVEARVIGPLERAESVGDRGGRRDWYIRNPRARSVSPQFTDYRNAGINDLQIEHCRPGPDGIAGRQHDLEVAGECRSAV